MKRSPTPAARNPERPSAPPAAAARPAVPYPLLACDAEPSAFFGSWRRPLIVLLAVAAAARMAHCYFEMKNDPSFSVMLKGLDTKTYDDWAMAILGGDWVSRAKGVFYMGPLFAYVLAAVYGLFGHHLLAGHLAMHALGLAGAATAYFAGAQWFSRRVAFVGALAGSLWSQLLFHEGTLLPEALVVFLTMLFLLAWGWTEREPRRWGRWVVLGMALGLASIQRGNMLLCGAAVAAWLVTAFHHWRWREQALALVLFLAGVIVSLSPVTLHNRLYGGQWVLITSNGPINLYLGNGIGASGSFDNPKNYAQNDASLQKMNAELKALQTKTAAVAGNTAGAAADRRRIDELERSVHGFWRRMLLKEIAEDPAGWIRLMFKKTGLFWSEFNIPDNYSFNLTQWFSPLLKWDPFRFDVIVTLGLIGIVLSLGAWRRLMAVHGFLLSFFLSVILVFVSGRFRLPVIYACSWFAAVTFWRMAAWIRENRWKPAAVCAAVAAGLILLLNPAPPVAYSITPNQFINYGLYYQALNRPEEGLRLYAQAEAYYLRQPQQPGQEAVWYQYVRKIRRATAEVLIQHQKFDEAIDVLAGIVAQRGAQEEDLELLFDLYVFRGRNPEAARMAETVVKNYPDLSVAKHMREALHSMGIELPNR